MRQACPASLTFTNAEWEHDAHGRTEFAHTVA